ncbi:hypothetical protein LCGC14_0844540 [marine sediment metagenome]|uniref:Uncharacterized protein n=1 Tax=marine sediment metagenome TaxID=412755 RepID=A0A0F9PC41_9ZZZZ
MKLLKRSIEVEAVLFTEGMVPKGILYEGYDPVTGKFEKAYLQTPLGDLPIKYGDYVIYENGKMYPCTPEAMEQNFIEAPEETENKFNGQISFETDGVKHGHLCLDDEGCLVFSGSKKQSAEDFIGYLQKNFIDSYIEKNAEQVKVGRAFRLIDEQAIGTKNYFLTESGRSVCLNCKKKGNVLLLLRNNSKDKRLYICKECVVKFILAIKENKNGTV